LKSINYSSLEYLATPLIEAMFESKSQFKRWTYSPLDKTINKKLSRETLNKIKERYGDITKAKVIPKNDNRFIFPRHPYPEIDLIAQELETQVAAGWESSGFFWYPPNGYCGWHTNSDCIGKRIYIAYADEDKQSFFRYYDAEKDEIITEWDNKGLNCHTFEVKPDKPCWHCVGSLNANRISFGFKQTK